MAMKIMSFIELMIKDFKGQECPRCPIVLSVNVLGYWKLKGEQNVLDGQISQRFLLILQNQTL